MESNNTQDKLDYQTLLMSHLDRLSMVSTSPAIQNKDSRDPMFSSLNNGEKALNWGVKYLQCIIPHNMKDKEYNESEKNLLKEYEASLEDSKKKESEYSQEKATIFMVNLRWEQLKNAINLLHRKGMLLNSRVGGKREGKRRSTQKEVSEVFEG